MIFFFTNMPLIKKSILEITRYLSHLNRYLHTGIEIFYYLIDVNSTCYTFIRLPGWPPVSSRTCQAFLRHGSIPGRQVCHVDVHWSTLGSNFWPSSSGNLVRTYLLNNYVHVIFNSFGDVSKEENKNTKVKF